MTAIFVIACSAEKQAHETTARDMYTAMNYRHFLAAAEAEAAATVRDLDIDAKVMILSAEHGLLDLDDTIAPYDTRMGTKGAIDARGIAGTMFAKGIEPGDEVYVMAPRKYREALTTAARYVDVPVFDLYEAATRGVGDQRGVASSLIRWAA